MLNIIRSELKIGATRPFRIFHITDLHLTFCGSSEGTYETELSKKRRACFPSAHESFAELRQYIANQQPDITAMTGDIIDFPLESNLERLYSFTEDCGEYLYTPGNHDWSYPREYHTHETYTRFMPLFRKVCGGDTDFNVCERNGVLLICIDDSSDCINERQLALFRAQVERGLPMIVFLHVPLYAEPLIEKVREIWHAPIVIGHEESNELTKQFCRELGRSNATVLTGHVHFSREDSLSEGAKQYITAPAALGNARLFDIE